MVFQMQTSSLRKFAYLSIIAAVAAISLRLLACYLTNPVNLLPDVL